MTVEPVDLDYLERRITGRSLLHDAFGTTDEDDVLDLIAETRRLRAQLAAAEAERDEARRESFFWATVQIVAPYLQFKADGTQETILEALARLLPPPAEAEGGTE